MSRSHINAAANSRLRIEIRDEVETKLKRSVSDHDCVRVASTQNLVTKLEFVINLLRILAARRIRALIWVGWDRGCCAWMNVD